MTKQNRKAGAQDMKFLVCHCLNKVKSPRHLQLLHLTRPVVSIAMGSRCCTPQPEPIPGSCDPNNCSMMVSLCLPDSASVRSAVTHLTLMYSVQISPRHPCLFPMYVVKASGKGA